MLLKFIDSFGPVFSWEGNPARNACRGTPYELFAIFGSSMHNVFNPLIGKVHCGPRALGTHVLVDLPESHVGYGLCLETEFGKYMLNNGGCSIFDSQCGCGAVCLRS